MKNYRYLKICYGNKKQDITAKKIGLLIFSICFLIFNSYSQENDWRNIENALSIIPNENYCDQPYAIINKKGEWVIVMTTGKGREGQSGQHIVSTISKDRGKTWEPLVDIEPASGPEASWVTPLIVPSGRIYVFYTYNSDNIREVLNYKGENNKRVDTLGKMMMKFSDDGGYTWSEERYEVPIRSFKIDANNNYNGKILFFWSVALPVKHNNAVYLPLTKVGGFTPPGEGGFVSGSGAILKSSNILFENDPNMIEWETLPDGDEGLLPPEGKVASEHNIVSMHDGSLYCVYRTDRGHFVHTYSRDNGHTWSNPEWATYTPGGEKIKQPRCLIKIHKFKNGKYAMFFHNNGGRHTSHPRGNRNPTWISGGIEKDGHIYWNQPEVFLYDMDYFKGISYPDWIEDNGEYYFSETQKSIARIHKIPNEFMEMLWNQYGNSKKTTKGLILEIPGESVKQGQEFNLPKLGRLNNGKGFALELKIKTSSLKKDQVLMDTRRNITEGYGPFAEFAGNGIVINILKTGALEFIMDDGRTPLIWTSSPRLIKPNELNHFVINVDAEAKILTFIINGVLWNGGERPFGYARFNPYMYDVNGNNKVRFSPTFKGDIRLFRIYDRFLYTSESINNYMYSIR